MPDYLKNCQNVEISPNLAALNVINVKYEADFVSKLLSCITMAASSYVTSLELIRVLYSRYNYHFGSIDSLNPDFEDPEKCSSQNKIPAPKIRAL